MVIPTWDPELKGKEEAGAEQEHQKLSDALVVIPTQAPELMAKE